MQFSVGGGGGESVQNRNMVDKVTQLGRKMTGTEVNSITQTTDEFSMNLALRILDGPSPPLFPEDSPLPSPLSPLPSPLSPLPSPLGLRA